MQQDNHNIQIDQQLRELEQYSLPDLSRQDDHWKSMAGMLVTVPTAQPVKGFSKTWKWITGVGVVTIVVIAGFFLLQKRGEHSFEGGNKEPQPVTQTMLPAKDSSSGTSVADTLAISDTTNGRAMERGHTSSAANDAVLNDLYDRLEKKFQYFHIDNGRDTVLYGKEGTMLSIPAHSFDTERITIMLQEFYTIKDMVGNLLYTQTTKGEQLITGGMFYIEAVRQGRENENANIRTGYSIRLDIPRTTDKVMNLFYGEVSDGSTMPDVTWRLTDWRFTSASTSIDKVQKRGVDVIKTANKPTSRTRNNNSMPFAQNETVIPTDPLANLLLDTPRTRSLPMTDTSGVFVLRDSVSSPVTIRNDISLTLPSNFEYDLNDRYGVDLRSLGWINCDRFYYEPGPKVDFYVQLDKPAATAYTYLVFERFQSIMPATGLDNNQTIAFRNVPANEKVTVICVGAENGKLLTVTKATVTSAGVLKLAYEENTASGFSRSLAGKPAPNRK